MSKREESYPQREITNEHEKPPWGLLRRQNPFGTLALSVRDFSPTMHPDLWLAQESSCFRSWDNALLVLALAPAHFFNENDQTGQNSKGG